MRFSIQKGKLNLRCLLFSLSCDVLFIERAQGGRVAAQDHCGENAENKIDDGERERNSEGVKKGKKHNGKSRKSADDMSRNTVIGFNQEASDVGAAVGVAYLIFMEAREATPFGNIFFPGVDFELAVKLAFGLLDGEELRFGREPFFGQTPCEKSCHGIDEEERNHADDRAQKDFSEGSERMYFGKNEIEKRDKERSPRHRDQIEHDKPLLK